MTDINPCRVAIIYGGKSGEHEISLLSAHSVLKHIDRKRYQVTPIGVDKLGHWHQNITEEILLPTQSRLEIKGNNSTPINAPLNNADKQAFDVIFPIMHGPLYEDGCLQGLLELSNIPYVGCGVLSSALAMDKVISKQLLATAGIPVVPFIPIALVQWQQQPQVVLDQIQTQLQFPLFVKPANLGSSVGAHKVKSIEQLKTAINDAFQYDHKILIEKAINAREIEIGLIENIEQSDKPLASVIGEIVVNPKYEFYNYTAKYLDPDSIDLQIPAVLDQHQAEKIRNYAQQAFVTLNCNGYARADFLVDRQSGAIYFSEMNTIPGFTNMSMFPLMWDKSGLSYSDLITKLIELARLRNQRQQSIKREWHPK